MPCTALQTLDAAESIEPIDLLASSSLRSARIVAAISRRRDVRTLRSRIVLVLLGMRCGLTGNPSKSWYVPGAVARLGAEGIRRAWPQAFGTPAPCLRTLRSHLRALEKALVLVQAPGHYLPMMQHPEHRERRPRHADTIHLIESDELGDWWAGEGARRLELEPTAKTNPTTWKRVFGEWRSAAKGCNAGQGMLFEDVAGAPQPSSFRNPARNGGRVDFAAALGTAAPGAESTADAEQKAASETLRKAIRQTVPNVFDLLLALRAAGAHIQRRNSFRVGANPLRLRGSAAMLLRALDRGDALRNRGAWLFWAFKHAKPLEMREAIGEVLACR